MGDPRSARNEPVREPTLRDLLVQWTGMTRHQSIDPDVSLRTRRWSEWLRFSEETSDEALLDIVRRDRAFLASLVLSGHLERWNEKFGRKFEMADVYHTPTEAEPDLRLALRTRITPGPLRDLIVADLEEARVRLTSSSDDVDLEPLREMLRDDDAGVTRPQAPAAELSDWNLLDGWQAARTRLAFESVYRDCTSKHVPLSPDDVSDPLGLRR